MDTDWPGGTGPLVHEPSLASMVCRSTLRLVHLKVEPARIAARDGTNAYSSMKCSCPLPKKSSPLPTPERKAPIEISPLPSSANCLTNPENPKIRGGGGGACRGGNPPPSLNAPNPLPIGATTY